MIGPLLSDLDGTIADTAPAIFESLRRTCAALDIDLTPEKELTWALGPPLHWCLEQLGVDAERLEEAVAIFEAAHIELMHLVRPMPDADVVIRELAAQGVQIGVATIKPQHPAEVVLDVVGLRDCITVVNGRTDDMDQRSKTDLLREVVSQVGGDSPLYVGDHENDARAAHDLDIPFLWYPQHSWTEIREAILTGAPAPGR